MIKYALFLDLDPDKKPDINQIGLLSDFRNLWNQVQAKGRSWGVKKDGKNPYFGSHFTFIDGDEVVLLVGRKKNESWPVIFQFKKTKKTIIGEKIKKILSSSGIKLENGN